MPDLWLWPHVILPTPGARVIFVTWDDVQHEGEYWPTGQLFGGWYVGTTKHKAIKWRWAT